MDRVSIEFTLRILSAHFRLDSTGVYSQQDALNLLTKAYALAPKHGCDALLIDAPTNRGANVRVFTHEPQALAWLIQKPKSA